MQLSSDRNASAVLRRTTDTDEAGCNETGLSTWNSTGRIEQAAWGCVVVHFVRMEFSANMHSRGWQFATILVKRFPPTIVHRIRFELFAIARITTFFQVSR
jgi:hypothetical protein